MVSWHVAYEPLRTSAHIPSSAKSLHFPDNFDYAWHSNAWKPVVVVVHHVCACENKQVSSSWLPGSCYMLLWIHLTSRDALHEVVEDVSVQKQTNWGMGLIVSYPLEFWWSPQGQFIDLQNSKTVHHLSADILQDLRQQLAKTLEITFVSKQIIRKANYASTKVKKIPTSSTPCGFGNIGDPLTSRTWDPTYIQPANKKRRRKK